jgi:hypothetical protein
MRTTALLIGLATLAFGQPAHADKFDSTLDVSLATSGTMLHVDADRLRVQWLAPGATGRIGMSLEGFRFGAGIGFFGAPASPAPGFRGPLWGIPIELYTGYAFGRARKLQPYIELRASVTHLFAPTQTEMATAWAFSIMPRVGVRIPLNEYFFIDVGAGVGAGAERVQITWALGIPIPTANL